MGIIYICILLCLLIGLHIKYWKKFNDALKVTPLDGYELYHISLTKMSEVDFGSAGHRESEISVLSGRGSVMSDGRAITA